MIQTPTKQFILILINKELINKELTKLINNELTKLINNNLINKINKI